MAYTRIGVDTSVSVQAAPSAQSVPSGRAQFVGVTQKGPIGHPYAVTSIRDFERLFGGRAPYSTIYDELKAYFTFKGAEAFITRVVGPAATNGSVTLTDGAATPKSVLSVEVIDPGPYSKNYSAVVTIRPDGMFDLTVVDTSTDRTIVAFLANESTADLASRAIGSTVVRVKDLGAGVLPKAGTFPLSAGSDDRASITVDHYVRSLDAHKEVPGGVAIATPGMYAPVTAAKIGAHAAAHQKIYITDLSPVTTISEACAIGDQLMGGAYSASVGVVYPAVRAPEMDMSSRTRTVGAAAYVLASRSITHTLTSPAQPPAGQARSMVSPASPVYKLDLDDINELNQHGINGIQTTGGVAYLNNWSSLSTDQGMRELAHTDALHQIEIEIKAGAERLLWRPNEGMETIRGEATGIVDAVMQTYSAAGYLFPAVDAEGNAIDAGYTVVVEQIRESRQNAPYNSLGLTVGVRLSPIIRHVTIGINAQDPSTAF